MSAILEQMQQSAEPSIRYRVLTRVLDCDPASAEMQRLQRQIQSSPRVARLLSERDESGCIPYHPYTKWYGAHWVLAVLADLDYPPGDESLLPLRSQVYRWLLDGAADETIYRKRKKTIAGRVRTCASQEGNALFSLLKLGLADERAAALAEALMDWQWPDGGWNCDKRPQASRSSFMETLIPLRALALYARLSGDPRAAAAAERAAEVFLKRRLFQRAATGEVISEAFLRLHYPCYWHYDILFGLKVLAEAGFIGDPRCHAALDVLEFKRLPDGGFPAEERYYHVSERRTSGRSLVDWGGVSKRRMNEFVTADALFVLKKAGRLL